MKMFSGCSGECILCSCHGCCLAGHGDDDFYPATDEQLLQRLDELNNKQYTDDRKDIIIAELKRRGVSIYL